MGESFDKMTNAYNGLKACELERLSNLTTEKVYLLIIGISVLCFGFLLLAVYLFMIDKHLNLIWELLRIRIQKSFFKIRNSIENRISHIQSQREILSSNIDSNALNDRKTLKFRHSLRTLSRISIIFIIALVLTFIQYFIFEQKLQTSLQYHTTLISSLMIRRILISKLGFFTLENCIENTNYSLSSEFPFYNGLGLPKKSVNSVRDQLVINIQGMENPATVSVLSSKLQHDIYISYPSNLTFLKTGTLRALFFYMYESLYFAFNYSENDFASLYQYFIEGSAFSDAVIVIASLFNQDMTDLIESKLHDLYIFTGGFGLMFLLIYFCYYYPMLSNDISFLNKLTDLIHMIPKIPKPMNPTSASTISQQKTISIHIKN